ncbi:MAG: TonB-dependent receptor plug domain-containing protein [Phenylobacterium sp.]|uniref:TonB-dependent receptor plug domain-containing protein n=1 Tax=Phenylobacterium sp. TaxID=1871053 RepID=UPI0039196707
MKSRSTLSLLAGVSLASLLSAGAAQADDQTLEELVVTGSRGLPRTVQDSPVPIDVLSADDIKQVSYSDTNDVLKTLVPSYSLARQPISDGATFIRPATLRGLSSDKTLLLVNSKRRHRASLVTIGGDGSQPPDAATVPASALKSVEVLRDGAGAQYGSDAIAGVINFLLKDNSSGASLTAMAGQYYKRDGEEITVSGNLGLPLTAKGFISLSGEYSTVQPTSRGKQYCNVGVPNLAPGFCVDAYAAANPAYAALVKRPVVQKWGQPEMEAFRGFVNSGIEFDNGSKLYAFANYSNSKAKEDFNYRPPADVGSTGTIVDDLVHLQDGSLFSFQSLWPAGFTPQFFGQVTDYSLTGGYKGEWGEKFTYDLSARYGRNKISYTLTDTFNPSMGPASPSEFYDGDLISSEYAFNADFTYEVGGPFHSPVVVAFGAEFRNESYEIVPGDVPSYIAGTFAVPDPFDFCTNEANVADRTLRPTAPQNAGIVCNSNTIVRNGVTITNPVYRTLPVGSNGFPGNTPAYSGELSRESYAGYVEASADITEKLFATLAFRAENFSDFGDTFDYKLAARYEITDAFGIRGSVGTGFRAPTPGQLFTTNVSTRVDNGVTIASGLFPATNPVAKFLGAKELEPEKSFNLSFGLTASLFDGLNVTVDFYQIKLEDQFYAVTPITVTPAIRAQLLAAGVPGADTIGQVQFFQNAFDSTTKGIDIVATYNIGWENGQTTRLMGSFNYNKYKIDTVPTFFDAEAVFDFENATPRWRSVLTASHHVGPFVLLGRANIWGPYENQYSTANPVRQKWDPLVQMDVEATWNITEAHSLTIGARNVFDKFPDPDLIGESATNGRIYRSDTIPDWQGGFYFVRVSASF